MIASDYYLIPTKVDPLSTIGMDLLKIVITNKSENFGLSLECCGVVLTLVETNTNIYMKSKKYIENDNYWKNYLYKSPLSKRVELAEKQMSQKFILDMDNSNAKSELSYVVKELIKRIGDE